MKSKYILKRLEDLPHNSRVCLYGAGEAGGFFRRLLSRRRKDVKIVCYADAFKDGEKDGLNIIRPEELNRYKEEIDLILVTSIFWQEIEERLRMLGLNYMIVDTPLFQRGGQRDKLIYKIIISLLFPINRILSTLQKNKTYENSVLHISYMVHIPYYTVRILRRYGIKADYLAIGTNNRIWDKCDYQVIYSPNLFIKSFQEFLWFWRVVAKYEIIHSHFGIMLTDSGWEFSILKRMDRKIVIHHRGCNTIRNREKNFSLNPDPDYNICYECDYNGMCCSDENELRRRRLSEKFGDLFLVTTPDMKDFLPNAIHLPFFTPEIEYPKRRIEGSDKDRMKIVHVTVHPGIEGTKYIKRAIDNLIKKGYKIEFIFLKGVPHNVVLKELASADLAIGKLKMGYYANAQIESMYMGIPTITYVRPEFMTEELRNSGFIFSDLKTLEGTLQYYLDNPEELKAKRAIARESILKLHNNNEIAEQLIDLYRRLRENGLSQKHIV